MEVINYSILRNNLKEVLDRVTEDQETYIVNRGSSNAVIISLDEYNSWQETIRLMESEPNRKNLSEAIDRDYIVAEEALDYKKRTIKEDKTNPSGLNIGSDKKSKENKKLTGEEFVKKWRGVIKGADDSNLRESYLNNKYK